MRKQRIMLIVVLLSAIFLTGFWLKWAAWQTAQAAPLAGQVRYVDADGVCSGHTPCYNHPELAAQAAEPGDVILLQADTFTNSSNAIAGTPFLRLTKNVTMIGGYDDTYQDPPYGSTSFLPISASHIIDVSYTAVTLTHLTLSGGELMYGGSALYIYGSAAILRNSVITGNTSVNCPGIYAEMSSLIVLENNAIYSNTSNGTSGGGVICALGAQAGSQVNFNEIYSNTAFDAAAMRLNASYVSMDANKIYGNVATAGAVGGIVLNSGSYTLTNNYLGRNTSAQAPSALAVTGEATAVLIHNTFNGNGAFPDGGMILFDSSTGVAHNNIFAGGGSSAIDVRSAGNLTIENNLFFEADTPFSVTVGSTILYSGVMIDDPLFDPLVPYAIRRSSPAEGKAILTTPVVDHDIDGRPRPLGSGPDLGAMETDVYHVYYVDADGVCGGLVPCYPHPRLAANVALPGDVIKMQADTFTSTLGTIHDVDTLHLNKGLTLIGGYDNDYAGFLGTTVLDSTSYGAALFVDSTAAVTLSNLTLTGGGVGLDVVPGATVTLKNSILTGNSQCAFRADASLVILKNNALRGNGNAVCLSQLLPGSQLSFNEIYSNSTSTGETVMSIVSSTLLIEGNKIYANRSSGINMAFSLTGGDYTFINNYLGNNAAGSSGRILAITGDATATFIHNTFNGNGSPFGAGETLLIHSSTAKLYNNIFSSAESYAVTVQSGGFLTADTNLFFGVIAPFNVTPDSTLEDSNVLIADPQFDPSIPYVIPPNSPAEGKAIPGLIGDDIDGRLRPVGTGPDLGAMEAAEGHTVSVTQDVWVDFDDPSGLTTTLFVPARTFSGCDGVEFLYSAFQSPGHPLSDTVTYAGRAFDLSLSCAPQAPQYQIYLPLAAMHSTANLSSSVALQGAFPLPIVRAPSLPVYRPVGPQLAMEQLSQPVTVTLGYRDQDIVGLDENSLVLYYWNGQSWVDATSTCPVPLPYGRDPDANQIAAAICHLSEFILGGH